MQGNPLVTPCSTMVVTIKTNNGHIVVGKGR